MPEGRKKVYANGTVKDGKQLDSRGKILGIKGTMIDKSDLPEWATDRKKVEDYQNAVNDEYKAAGKKPPITNFGKTEYGKGRFGPQTASILKERGTKGLKGFDGDTTPLPPSTTVKKLSAAREPIGSPMSGSSSVSVRNTTTPRIPRGELATIESKVQQNGPVDRTLTGSVKPVTNLNTPTAGRKKVFDKKKVNDLVPYISNIANSLRKTPRPDAPGLINPIGTRQVNYDAQRVEADRQMRGANNNASATLDENTAASVRSGNLATGIYAKNRISETESNKNAELGMRSNEINAGIEGQNVAMGNQWKRDLTEAQIASQMNASDNLSNADDKYIMQGNENEKRDLDRKRLSVYSGMFASSGVMDRQRTNYNTELNKYGLEDDIVNPPAAGVTTSGRRPLLQGLFNKRGSTTTTAPETAPIPRGEVIPSSRFSNEPVDRTLNMEVNPLDSNLKRKFASSRTSFQYGKGGFMRTKVYN